MSGETDRVLRAGLAELVVLGGVEVIPQHALYQETDPHGDYYDAATPVPRPPSRTPTRGDARK